MSDAQNKRFEVPFLPVSDDSKKHDKNDVVDDVRNDVDVVMSKTGFRFKIVRKSSNQKVL